MRLPPAGIFRKSPPEPSISFMKPMKPSPSSDGSTSMAPAASPNRMQVLRSVIVENARHGVGPDDEHLLMSACHNEVGGGGQSINESGAGCDEIETPRTVRANAILHQTGGGRKKHIGRDGADDDGVELLRVYAALREYDAGGFGGHIRCGDLRCGDVALRNSGSLYDPLIAGINDLL